MEPRPWPGKREEEDCEVDWERETIVADIVKYGLRGILGGGGSVFACGLPVELVELEDPFPFPCPYPCPCPRPSDSEPNCFDES